MWESRAAFWREFSKRRWESALFADFHGRGIFHQAFNQTTDTTDLSNASGLLIRLSSNIPATPLMDPGAGGNSVAPRPAPFHNGLF